MTKQPKKPEGKLKPQHAVELSSSDSYESEQDKEAPKTPGSPEGAAKAPRTPETPEAAAKAPRTPESLLAGGCTSTESSTQQAVDSGGHG